MTTVPTTFPNKFFVQVVKDKIGLQSRDQLLEVANIMDAIRIKNAGLAKADGLDERKVAETVNNAVKRAVIGFYYPGT